MGLRAPHTPSQPGPATTVLSDLRAGLQVVGTTTVLRSLLVLFCVIFFGFGLLNAALLPFTVRALLYALLSWFAGAAYNPAAQILSKLVEPLLAPIRRVVPPLGGLDLSAVFLLIALQALQILLR